MSWQPSADPRLCSRCSLYILLSTFTFETRRPRTLTLNMPQFDYPGSFPYSIYACERPHDHAPALVKCEQHEPLKSDNHIRLLKLFPPGWPDRLTENLTREEDTNIQCEIYQVPLPSVTTKGRPYFATLSYAWGDPKPAKQIRCGDTMVSVPQSLFDALLYIRHLRKPRLLWVDCLCIDQTNSEEKSRQVQRMHLVYGVSHCVAWLGVETDRERDLTAMLPVLNWLSEALESVIDQGSTFDWSRWDPKFTWHNLKTRLKLDPIRGCSSLCDLPWAALYQCLNRDIFRRLWCVQETLLARSNDLRTSVSHLNINVLSRSCVLLCFVLDGVLLYGSDDDADRHYYAIASLRSLCLDMNQTLRGKSLSGHYLPCIRYVRSARDEPKVATAAATAMMLRSKECSDPRDRVFALAGLCNLGTSYQISYSKSTLAVQQVFVDFTLHCLRSTMSLELFRSKCRITAFRARTGLRHHDMQHRDWLHRLPSWCPDFAGPEGYVRDLDTNEKLRKSPLKACRGLPARFTVFNRRCVAAMGIYIGSVKRCSSAWHNSFSGDAEVVKTYASFQRCASSLKPLLPGHSLWRLFFDVCTAGLEPRHCPAWPSVSKVLPAKTRDRMVRNTIGAAWIMEHVPGLASKGEMFLSRKLDHSTWVSVSREVDTWLYARNQGRRIFTTDNNAAILGSGLDGTRVGDIVCVPYGSDVPFVLRQVGNKGEYKLIGECYVAGIMHGEALDMGLEEREFRLI
jgi:hypothetical protein